MKKKSESFQQILDRLSRRHGINQVFPDFLTLLVCAFSHGHMEKLYLETIGKYEKQEAYTFSNALAALVIEMTGDGTGMVDVIGNYFEENISHGKNGQFFTPQNICDMMARVMAPVRSLERISDPACGSGRMLMAMAKINRYARFYASDNDKMCAMMTVVNMTLNGMFGEVAWMNSLTNQFYSAWLVEPTVKGCPYVRQISEKESFIHLRLLEKSMDPAKTFVVTKTQMTFKF